MVETLLGGLFGGIFRILPEVLKWLDRKDERKHELSMQDKAIDFQRLKGDQRIEEVRAEGDREWNTGAIDSIKEAIAGQFRPSGVKWVDALSTIIRPLITIQWVLFLYPAVIVSGFVLSIQSGVAPLDALVKTFGPDEKALVGAILNFWFMGRIFDRVR